MIGCLDEAFDEHFEVVLSAIRESLDLLLGFVLGSAYANKELDDVSLLR